MDLLGAATTKRVDFLSASSKKHEFASHKSVRDFFSVTELDDHNPKYGKDLSLDDAMKVLKCCHTVEDPHGEGTPGISIYAHPA